MKRMILALLALVMLTGGMAGAYNPYAPNPFDAIEQDTWEYQYIRDLTQAGLTGSDMNKFAPGYALSRVEMRDMIAVALTNRSRADEVRQKEIDKLAAEYKEDLEYANGGKEAVQIQEEEENPAGFPFEWRQEG